MVFGVGWHHGAYLNNPPEPEVVDPSSPEDEVNENGKIALNVLILMSGEAKITSVVPFYPFDKSQAHLKHA
jgi:hypothetical protein